MFCFTTLFAYLNTTAAAMWNSPLIWSITVISHIFEPSEKQYTENICDDADLADTSAVLIKRFVAHIGYG